MPFDNQDQYGFRLFDAGFGGELPSPRWGYLASAYQAAVNGGGNVHLGKGDPVKILASGMLSLAEGSEAAAGATQAPLGICIGGCDFWDASQGVMAKGDYVPGGTTYGTVLSRQSVIKYYEVGPAIINGVLWEVDIDEDTASFDTIAEYQAAQGAQADHVLSYSSATSRARPRLDISTVGTGDGWKIHGLSKTMNNIDLDGAAVKVLVSCFETQTAEV